MNYIDFSNANWIWGKDNKSVNQKLVIRKRFNVKELPNVAEAYKIHPIQGIFKEINSTFQVNGEIVTLHLEEVNGEMVEK